MALRLTLPHRFVRGPYGPRAGDVAVFGAVGAETHRATCRSNCGIVAILCAAVVLAVPAPGARALEPAGPYLLAPDWPGIYRVTET